MNRLVKKLIGLFLGICIALGLRYGEYLISEKNMAPKIEALSGIWHCMEDAGYEVEHMLNLADFTEKEQHAMDELSLNVVKEAVFRQDKTYRISYNVEATKEQVRQFYHDAMDDLYEHRADLTEVYSDEVVIMHRDEFFQLYAGFYGMDTFEEFLDALVDNAFEYDKMGQESETGTYTIQDSDILCTLTGRTQPEAMGYTLAGDELTLIYSDGTETYLRVG